MSSFAPTLKYKYRPVQCSNCNWRGKRGFRTGRFACPCCGAHGSQVKFITQIDRDLHAALWPTYSRIAATGRRTLDQIRDELKQIVAQTRRFI
jgi:hypothetical protein